MQRKRGYRLLRAEGPAGEQEHHPAGDLRQDQGPGDCEASEEVTATCGEVGGCPSRGLVTDETLSKLVYDLPACTAGISGCGSPRSTGLSGNGKLHREVLPRNLSRTTAGMDATHRCAQSVPYGSATRLARSALRRTCPALVVAHGRNVSKSATTI